MMTSLLPKCAIAHYTLIKNAINLFALTALFIAPLTYVITPLSHAEIYQWTDSQGNTHFSDHPPEEQVSSEEVSSQLSPLNRDSSSDETKKLQQLFKRPTPEEQALQQQEQAQQQKREQQINQTCAKARKRLEILKGPVFFTDDNGNEFTVTEEERRQRVIQLEQEIRQYCS